jgi:hypothetical protein
MMNDTAVAFPRLVLILSVDSIRLSSNTGPSPFRVQFAFGRASAGSGIPDPPTQSHPPAGETKGKLAARRFDWARYRPQFGNNSFLSSRIRQTRIPTLLISSIYLDIYRWPAGCMCAVHWPALPGNPRPACSSG